MGISWTNTKSCLDRFQNLHVPSLISLRNSSSMEAFKSQRKPEPTGHFTLTPTDSHNTIAGFQTLTKESCSSVLVKSPTDFNEKMKSTETDSCINLLIDFKANLLNPNVSSIHSRHVFIKGIFISGFFSITFLSFLLSNHKNIEKLVVEGPPLNNEFIKDQPKITLQKLQFLTINVTDGCKEVFEYFLNNLKIESLKTLQIDCSSEELECNKFLQNILETNRFELVDVQLRFFDLSTPLFTDFFFVLHNVIKLSIQFLSGNITSSRIFAAETSATLTRLTELNIEGIHISEYELPNIVKISTLQIMSLRVNAMSNIFDLTWLVLQFPTIVALHIDIKFKNMTDCYIARSNKTKNDKVFISTNCFI